MRLKFIQNIIDTLRGKNKDKIDWSNEKFYEKNICKAYKKYMGDELDLKNPKTFSEKMQWLRIYDNTPLKKSSKSFTHLHLVT